MCGVAGLRKNGSFLPVPDTWRQSLKLRDKYQVMVMMMMMMMMVMIMMITILYQWCLLVPWIILYGLLTGLWCLASIPACAALASV